MTNLNFNIYGFSSPTTKAEYLNLLREARRASAHLHAQLISMGEKMEEKFVCEHVE